MTEQQDKHPKRCEKCSNYHYKVVETEGEFCDVVDDFIDDATDVIEKVGCISFDPKGGAANTGISTEKDNMHWITGQELREIYADDLSLDKYDEIRKRPASQNSGLYEPVGQKPDPCLVCQIRLKGSHQCDGNPCGSKVEYARKEHDRAIEQAAREDEQRKWRDELAEAAAEARKDEREKVLKEIMDYVRKSKYFGKHFMLIMCESLQNPATPAVKEQKP